MSDILIDRPELASLGTYEFGWSDSDVAGAAAERGISPEVVSEHLGAEERAGVDAEEAPQGPRSLPQEADARVGSRPSGLDFDNIKYFVRSTAGQAQKWEDLPDDIKKTYEKLGIPEAERKNLIAGVAAQYESEVVYHQIREDLAAQGVIFTDTDTGLREHPEFFEEYFGTIIPPATTSSPR